VTVCGCESSLVHIAVAPTPTSAGFCWKASVVLLAPPETIEIVSRAAAAPAAIVAVVLATVVVFLAVVVLVFAAQNGDGWNAPDVGELVIVLFAATN
jgi:hypothetical protein